MKLRINENHISELQSEELNEGWSLVLYMQLLQLQKESLKKILACTGYSWYGILFATAKVAYITAMIILHLILHSSVHIHDLHNYIHDFIIILSRVYNEPIQRPASSWLASSIGRALHWYCSGFLFTTAKVAYIQLQWSSGSFNSIHDRDVMVTFDANEYIRKMIFQ